MFLKIKNQQLPLYFNTLKYLKFSQIFYLFLRSTLVKHYFKSKRKQIKVENIRIPAGSFLPELDEDESFLKRFDWKMIQRGEMEFLHEVHPVDFTSWTAEASPLWNFNLYYFEYGIYLANLWKTSKDEKYYNLFKNIVCSWINNTNPYHKSWHPYPTSLRLINWLVCISNFDNIIRDDKVFFCEVLKSMYIQYRTLILRQEKWLLGNHYFENLFTIVVLSHVFNEVRFFKKYIKKLEKEIAIQILEDGMHYELSPMYHKIILTDLIRLQNIASEQNLQLGDWLISVLAKMENALLIMETGFEKTPLFNDSGNNVSRSTECILKALKKFNLPECKRAQLTEAGYYRLENRLVSILIDAGKIAPDNMSGHGHCDCLSFEIAIRKKKIFTNSGTYQYQGDKRNYFRSTKAHNTVMLDGNEQSQCWAEHRVAKRINHIKVSQQDNKFTGEYTNYCGQIHKREFILEDNKLKVYDSGNNEKTFNSFLHIAPGFSVNEKLEILDKERVVTKVSPKNCNYIIHRTDELADVAMDFGLIQKGTCIEFFWNADEKSHGYEIVYKL